MFHRKSTTEEETCFEYVYSWSRQTKLTVPGAEIA